MGGGRSLYSPKKAARAGTRPLLFQLHRLFLSLPPHRWDAAVLKGWRGEKNNNLDARTTTAPPRPDGAASALFNNRQSILKRATGAGGRPAGRRERERESKAERPENATGPIRRAGRTVDGLQYPRCNTLRRLQSCAR